MYNTSFVLEKAACGQGKWIGNTVAILVRDTASISLMHTKESRYMSMLLQNNVDFYSCLSL